MLGAIAVQFRDGGSSISKLSWLRSPQWVVHAKLSSEWLSCVAEWRGADTGLKPLKPPIPQIQHTELVEVDVALLLGEGVKLVNEGFVFRV